MVLVDYSISFGLTKTLEMAVVLSALTVFVEPKVVAVNVILIKATASLDYQPAFMKSTFSYVLQCRPSTVIDTGTDLSKRG